MLFGICPRTASTLKFWLMKVVTYGYFMVIVELCRLKKCFAMTVIWTSLEMLRQVIQLTQFESTVKHILAFQKGTDGVLTVNYLPDISLQLPFASAVLECNIEQYLLDFAYDPQNYAWYNKHQNVYLSHLKETEHPGFENHRNRWKYNWSKIFCDPWRFIYWIINGKD